MKSIRLDQLPRLALGEATWRPVRRTFGITGFAVNAYTGAAGQLVIELHDETSKGSGLHEELYLVADGHAEFEIDGSPLDAPAGTLVFVPPGVSRLARAVADETTVLVIGGKPGAALPTSPFEHWYAAEQAYRDGDYDRAVEVVSAGLEDWPDHYRIHYQLACYHTLAGRLEEGIAHLRRAADADPVVCRWAPEDDDLAALRDHPGWFLGD